MSLYGVYATATHADWTCAARPYTETRTSRRADSEDACLRGVTKVLVSATSSVCRPSAACEVSPDVHIRRSRLDDDGPYSDVIKAISNERERGRTN